MVSYLGSSLIAWSVTRVVALSKQEAILANGFGAVWLARIWC
jgi:hypothetical protein